MARTKLIVIGIVIVLIALLVFRTSGYSLRPSGIQTDKGTVLSSIADLPTDLSCVAGNTPVGQDGSAESYYSKQDGDGYGICGAQQLVRDNLIGYKILD